jgi:hypothetical protein
MKKTLLVGILILFNLNLFAQNNYRSFSSGNWSDASTWEEEVSGVWTNPAPNGAPDSGDGTIFISDGHVVNVNSSINVDQVTIGILSQLIVDEGVTLTVANGITDDINISDDGFDFGFLKVDGILNVSNGANINNASTSTVAINGTYKNNDSGASSIIIGALWASTSTCEILGVTGTSTTFINLNQNFGNFIYNCPGQLSTAAVDFNGGFGNSTIEGNLIVQSTGSGTGSLRIFGAASNNDLKVKGNFEILGSSRVLIASGSGTSNTLSVSGNFIHSSTGNFLFCQSGNITVNVESDFTKNGSTASFNFSSGSGIATLNIVKNTTISSGSITESSTGSGVINFTGTGTFIGGGTILNTINLNITNTGDLDLGTFSLGGSGNFSLASGGTLRVGSSNNSGALLGNLTNSGTKTFSSGSTIIFNGSSEQFLGTSFPSDVNVKIDKSGSSPNNTVNMTVPLTINSGRTLQLSAGILSIGSNTLTINGTTIVNSGLISSSNLSNLTIGGTGALGTIPFSPGSSLNNFTLNRTSSGSATLGSDFTIEGVVDLENGNFIVNDRTLILSGSADNATGSNSGFLSGNTSTHLSIIGSGAFGELNFNESGGNSIASLTLDRSSGSFTAGTSLTINENLDLLNGTFSKDPTEIVTMASNSTVNRQASGGVDFIPGATTTYNVSYTGSTPLTTGPELPTVASGALNDLIVNASNTITLNAPIEVNGNLTITAGILNSSLSNHNVTLKGDFTNSGSYVANLNTTSYSGTAAQIIAQAPYHNLTINGSGVKSLEGNASLSSSGILTLTSGILDLNSKTLTLNNSATSAISLTSGRMRSETAGTYGYLAWNIGTATGTYSYPYVASNGNDIPVSFIKSTTGDIGTLSVGTFPSDANLTTLPNGVTSVNDVQNAIKRFWQIDKTGSSGTVDVTFTYASGEAPNNPPTGSFKMQRWNSVSGQWDAALSGQSNNLTARTITVPGISNFSPWGANDEQTPFPVELVDFEANLVDNHVELKWSTLTETKSSHFIIQRSTDAQHFDSIGTVISAGNSSLKLDYVYLDHSTFGLTKVVYYRLKQVDFDGQNKIYPMKAVHFIDHNESISVFPNPAENEVYIQTKIKEDLKLMIYNPLGKLVKECSITQSSSILDISKYEAGVYVFKFINGSSVTNKKIVIK